jgi:hypothetical protein
LSWTGVGRIAGATYALEAGSRPGRAVEVDADGRVHVQVHVDVKVNVIR